MQREWLESLATAARGVWADTDGVILPYVTLLLTVIIGTSVLALDGGRYMSLQSQLQKGADALALAGAAELDRMPNSTTRAVNAVNNLLANSSIFGTGGASNVTVSQVRFLDQLPASDTTVSTAPICTGGGCTPEQSVTARFIEVVVTPTSMPTILPAAFFGGATTVTAGASAVAGMNQVVCKFNPMFVCNPYETAGMTYAQATQALQNAVADPAIRRRLIQMRRGGGSDGQYSPGNYGFLSSSLGNGADALREAIAKSNPPVCFNQNGVDTKPGFVASVRDAVNVRFDIYNGSMNSVRNNPDYRPAMNVRKGYSFTGGNACNASPNADTSRFMGLPQDTCFNTNSCPFMGGRMGDGNWNFDAYWTVNHTLPAGGGLQTKPMVNGAAASNTNLPSRYDVYRYEIAHGNSFIRNPSGQGASPPPPNAERPNDPSQMCSASPTNDTPDRRILFAAIINCDSNLPPSLPLSSGRETGIPVTSFAKFFLTEPVTNSQDEIIAEMVELVTPGNSQGFNFDQVQLYR